MVIEGQPEVVPVELTGVYQGKKYDKTVGQVRVARVVGRPGVAIWGFEESGVCLYDLNEGRLCIGNRLHNEVKNGMKVGQKD